mgnify:CR=1 FL=1
MLNIKVTDDYKITSDGMQIIVQKRQVVDPTKSPVFDAEKHSTDLREEWKTWKYCGKVEQAIDLILRKRIFETDATNLSELKSEIVSFKTMISEQLQNN